MAWIAVSVVAFVGLVDLAGWIFDVTLFKNIGPIWSAMSVVKAACFVLMAIELAYLLKIQPSARRHFIFLIPGMLVGVIGLLTVVLYLIAAATGADPRSGGIPGMDFFWDPAVRLPLLTAILFVFTGCALCLLTMDRPMASEISHAFMVPTAVTSYIVFLSYVFDVESFRKFADTKMAFNTGIAFFALAIAVFGLRPNTWLTSGFSGLAAGSVMARRLLTTLLFIPPAIGWLRIQGEYLGMFTSEVGVALMSLTYTICLVVLVWLAARSVNCSDKLLRNSEKDFRAMFDLAAVGIAQVDIPTGRFLRVNERFCSIIGYTADELVGKSFLGITYADDRERDLETFRRAADGELPAFHSEKRYIKKDGAIVWADVKAALVRNDLGQPLHIVAAMEDITERKRLERRVEYLARFPSESPDPIFRVEAEGKLRYANMAATPVLEDWDASVDHKVPDLWRKRVVDSLLKEVPLEYEAEIGKDTYSFCVAPVVGKRYANIYGKKITELKEAHRREKQADLLLVTSQTALNTIKAMREGVALIEMNGTVRSVNPALIKMTGYSREELEGVNIVRLLPRMVDREAIDTVRKALKTILRADSPKLGEMTLIARNFRRIPILPAIAFIKNSLGKPTTIVLTVQDITEHKETERQNQIFTTLLALFARKTSRKEYLEAVVHAIHQWSGCPCVGIRTANDKKQIPFESHIGFPADFVVDENSMVIGNDRCICARIINGNPDSQDFVHLTSMGSFWCHDTIKHMDSLSTKEKERFRDVCVRNGLVSVAIVPIRHQGTTMGAIQFADRQQNMISVDVMAYAESTLSPIIGEAMYRFDMEQDLRSLSSRLSLAEERARHQIAIALHDTVGQSLALAKIKLGALGQLLKEKEPRTVLASIREMFDEAVQQTRTLSFELSPPILYELGLDAAVEWLGEEFQKRNGIQIHFQNNGSEYRIPEPISILFFQSARELLANVAKHAMATNVEITLHNDGKSVMMRVADNGKGMDHGAWEDPTGKKKSLGLFSIRERMRNINGTLEIQSHLEQGTMVILSAPILESDSLNAEGNNLNVY